MKNRFKIGGSQYNFSQCVGRKDEDFKFKVIEKVLDIGKVTRKVQGSAILYTEEVIIGHIDVDTIIIYFAYLNGRRNCFI